MNAKFVRENPDLVKINQKKRFLDPNIVDVILDYDLKWKNALYNYDNVEKYRKRVQKFIKLSEIQSPKTYTDDELTDIMETILKGEYELNQLKNLHKTNIIKVLSIMSSKINEFSALIKVNVVERDKVIHSLGNFLHESVPIEQNEELNPIIDTFEGHKPTSSDLKIHYDLCTAYNITDYDKGISVAGGRGYFWKHIGVKLNRALISYALDFLGERQYEFLETPHFMKKDQMELVAQLSDFNETLYKLEGTDQFLIATSEQPITASFANTKFKKTELPNKICGLSTCYRKEVGSHGKDTNGIFRVHQFEKIEQFCVTDKDSSWNQFNEMLEVAKEFYQSLGLSYRVVQIVSGGLNNAASMKYDIEAYFPGSNNYKELVSCSNCLDYFSKKISCKDTDKNYLHMLNGTLCANTRTICCILETYQTDTGIIIPPVLKPYFGKDCIN